MNYITPDYLNALQIPLLMGRILTDADGPDAQRVVVVNQTFARKFLHGKDPSAATVDKDLMIVGMVADVAMAPGIDASRLSGEEMIYIPAAQMDRQMLSIVHIWFQPSWIVRTAAPVEGLTAQMQRALASVDPNLPFSGFYSMRDLQAKRSPPSASKSPS